MPDVASNTNATMHCNTQLVLLSCLDDVNGFLSLTYLNWWCAVLFHHRTKAESYQSNEWTVQRAECLEVRWASLDNEDHAGLRSWPRIISFCHHQKGTLHLYRKNEIYWDINWNTVSRKVMTNWFRSQTRSCRTGPPQSTEMLYSCGLLQLWSAFGPVTLSQLEQPRSKNRLLEDQAGKRRVEIW